MELLDVDKYDHISFLDMHIFIPKEDVYAIDKIKKLLDIYDEYIYQMKKVEGKKILSDEEKEQTVEFIESLKRQKENEIGTFVERKKI